MDEKAIAFAGAVAAATVLGRRLRPAAKTAMKGYLWMVDATADARRSVSDLYAEAQAEHRVAAPGADHVATGSPAAADVTEQRPYTGGSRVPEGTGG